MEVGVSLTLERKLFSIVLSNGSFKIVEKARCKDRSISISMVQAKWCLVHAKWVVMQPMGTRMSEKDISLVVRSNKHGDFMKIQGAGVEEFIFIPVGRNKVSVDHFFEFLARLVLKGVTLESKVSPNLVDQGVLNGSNVELPVLANGSFPGIQDLEGNLLGVSSPSLSQSSYLKALVGDPASPPQRGTRGDFGPILGGTLNPSSGAISFQQLRYEVEKLSKEFELLRSALSSVSHKPPEIPCSSAFSANQAVAFEKKTLMRDPTVDIHLSSGALGYLHDDQASPYHLSVAEHMGCPALSSLDGDPTLLIASYSLLDPVIPTYQILASNREDSITNLPIVCGPLISSNASREVSDFGVLQEQTREGQILDEQARGPTTQLDPRELSACLEVDLMPHDFCALPEVTYSADLNLETCLVDNGSLVLATEAFPVAQDDQLSNFEAQEDTCSDSNESDDFVWDEIKKAFVHVETGMRFCTEDKCFYKWVSDDIKDLRMLYFTSSKNGHLSLTTRGDKGLLNESILSQEDYDRSIIYSKQSSGY